MLLLRVPITSQKKMVVTNSQVLSFAHAVIDGVRARTRLASKALAVSVCALLLLACENSTPSSASTASANDALEEEAGKLSVIISAEHADNAVLLSAELKNDSDQEIIFLPWGSPFEGAVTADFLNVKEVGSSEDVAYAGIMVKRMPPSAEDFKTVKSGGSIKQTVDISKSYNFCASTQYQLTYSWTLVLLNGNTHSIQSNTTTVFISDRFRPCL